MTWPDQSTYEGDFHQGKMDGQGKRTYANGNIHEGSYRDDKKHGPGKLYVPSEGGTYKEGTWNMGVMDNHW